MSEETKEYLSEVDYLENKLKEKDKEIFQKTLFFFDECAKILNEKEERIAKAIEYATNEMRIVNDNEYHELIEILKGENK